MKGRFAVSALLALTSVVALACDDDDDPTGGSGTPEIFDASLNGAAERPTPVVTAATGTATFSWREVSGGDEVTYSVSATGLSGNASLAHIHGPAGEEDSASPIVTLTLTSVGNNGVIASGTFTTTGHATINMDSLRVLLRNGNSYVNVHTAANPGGEVRGQIR